MKGIKNLLDRFYREHNFYERIQHDPIEFPHRYKRPEDIEVAGFISSCFAYGRVGLFKQVINRVLSRLDGNPYNFLLGFNIKRHERLFSDVRYRFNETRDIICLLYIISKILRNHKSIENVFKKIYKDDDNDIGTAMAGFVDYVLKINTSDVYGRDLRPKGLIQFFPTPVKGSACKRMNLFLRWMIRDKDIDFGIWHGIPKNRLIIPLDTHISRISRCLGFTERKSQDWKMAVEITEALKRLDPEDPLKYDFAMCHYGISGFCGTKTNDRSTNCDRCLLKYK